MFLLRAKEICKERENPLTSSRVRCERKHYACSTCPRRELFVVDLPEAQDLLGILLDVTILHLERLAC